MKSSKAIIPFYSPTYPFPTLPSSISSRKVLTGRIEKDCLREMEFTVFSFPGVLPVKGKNYYPCFTPSAWNFTNTISFWKQELPFCFFLPIFPSPYSHRNWKGGWKPDTPICGIPAFIPPAYSPSIFLLYFIFRYFYSGKGERKKYVLLFESSFFLTAFPLLILLPEKDFPGIRYHFIPLLSSFWAAAFFSCTLPFFPAKAGIPSAGACPNGFSWKKGILYGGSLLLFAAAISFLLHNPNSFHPVLTAFYIPLAGFFSAGAYYGRLLAENMQHLFRITDGKKLFATVACGVFSAFTAAATLILFPDSGEMLPYILWPILFIFSYSLQKRIL